MDPAGSQPLIVTSRGSRRRNVTRIDIHRLAFKYDLKTRQLHSRECFKTPKFYDQNSEDDIGKLFSSDEQFHVHQQLCWFDSYRATLTSEENLCIKKIGIGYDRLRKTSGIISSNRLRSQLHWGFLPRLVSHPRFGLVLQLPPDSVQAELHIDSSGSLLAFVQVAVEGSEVIGLPS